jgi:glycosyltransferase involved in cell wall biosynthesis
VNTGSPKTVSPRRLAGLRESGRPLRLCRVVTVPLTFATLLREQIDAIVRRGIDLTLVSSAGPELDAIARAVPTVKCCSLPLTRQMSPTQDAQALLKLVRLLLDGRFDILHSSTPKAGLVAAVAGALARVPVRLHTYTGQVWVELHGPMRTLMRQVDRLIGHLSTATYADSASQREFLIAQRLIAPHKITTLGAGSISGVDLARFNPELDPNQRQAMRRELGIAEDSMAIVFVGRLTKDKGIAELVRAFGSLRTRGNDVDLLVMGPQEPERDPPPPETLAALAADPRIHKIGFADQPEKYLALADIFCLPSYREGFPTVVIEAGAMRLPVVATRIVGLVDAVVDGVTGLLVPPKETEALTRALQTLIDAPDLRRQMGLAARRRAERQFDAAAVNAAVVDEYFRLARTR